MSCNRVYDCTTQSTPHISASPSFPVSASSTHLATIKTFPSLIFCRGAAVRRATWLVAISPVNQNHARVLFTAIVHSFLSPHWHIIRRISLSASLLRPSVSSRPCPSPSYPFYGTTSSKPVTRGASGRAGTKKPSSSVGRSATRHHHTGRSSACPPAGCTPLLSPLLPSSLRLSFGLLRWLRLFQQQRRRRPRGNSPEPSANPLLTAPLQPESERKER